MPSGQLSSEKEKTVLAAASVVELSFLLPQQKQNINKYYSFCTFGLYHTKLYSFKGASQFFAMLYSFLIIRNCFLLFYKFKKLFIFPQNNKLVNW